MKDYLGAPLSALNWVVFPYETPQGIELAQGVIKHLINGEAHITSKMFNGALIIRKTTQLMRIGDYDG